MTRYLEHFSHSRQKKEGEKIIGMNGGGPQVTFSTTTSSKGESLARGNYSKTSECNVSSIFHTGIFFLLEITILEKKRGEGAKNRN